MSCFELFLKMYLPTKAKNISIEKDEKHLTRQVISDKVCQMTTNQNFLILALKETFYI